MIREDVQLDNLSVGGLYIRIPQQVETGSQIGVAVRLSTDTSETFDAIRLVARGVVLRNEPQMDGSCGIAVRFTRRRML
jgi:hypothetical protein